jgi:hypothetical protein
LSFCVLQMSVEIMEYMHSISTIIFPILILIITVECYFPKYFGKRKEI